MVNVKRPNADGGETFQVKQLKMEPPRQNMFSGIFAELDDITAHVKNAILCQIKCDTYTLFIISVR